MAKQLIHFALVFILMMLSLTGCYEIPANNNATATLSQNISWADSSVWEAMASNFRLPSDTNQQAVNEEIRWWRHHQSYLYKILSDSRPYIYYIYRKTQNRGLPAELALVPAIESQYNPFAYSRVGAVGFWQIMPGTASGARVTINWWYDGRRDLAESTKAALDYLIYLHEFFNNNWLLALAAYDSGAGTVENAIYYNKRHGRPTDFWDLPLPTETRMYVPKILALANIVRDPSYYNIKLPYVSNEPYLVRIKLGSQMDISTAAKLAGISTKKFRKLNPGFRRWATMPGGENYIFIPITRIQHFKNNLKSLAKNHRVSWQHYTIERGDTLSTIALKYKTTSNLIRQVNNLRNSVIHPGQELLIPGAYHGKLDKHTRKSQAMIAELKLPGPKQYVYKTKPSDSYWKIAKTFDVTIKEIRFWNNLAPNHKLKAGQKIIIWSKKNVQLYEIKIIKHTVKPGETLNILAEKYHTKVKHIKRINRLNNNIIRIGQTLKIPYNLHPVPHHKSSSHKPIS